MQRSGIIIFAAAKASSASSQSQTTKASRPPRNSGECVLSRRVCMSSGRVSPQVCLNMTRSPPSAAVGVPATLSN